WHLHRFKPWGKEYGIPYAGGSYFADDALLQEDLEPYCPTLLDALPQLASVKSLVQMLHGLCHAVSSISVLHRDSKSVFGNWIAKKKTSQ
ncbi:hypothetical protein, partial [Hymenobacter saemangeumensis]|uniref:hypothetical protein n=1 Tax=Hymenobacter saemangeumensis TaxID=1084522 RepID=UPI0031F0B993